jgi:hypothetical protein
MPRTISFVLIGLGLLGAVYAFNMSVTASGTNIANLSLMSARLNIILVAGVCALAGVILFTASGKSELDRKAGGAVTNSAATLTDSANTLVGKWAAATKAERQNFALAAVVFSALLWPWIDYGLLLALPLGLLLGYLCTQRNPDRKSAIGPYGRVITIAVLGAEALGFFIADPTFVIVPFWLIAAWQIHILPGDLKSSIHIRTPLLVITSLTVGGALLFIVANYMTIKNFGLGIRILGSSQEQYSAGAANLTLTIFAGGWLLINLIKAADRKFFRAS